MKTGIIFEGGAYRAIFSCGVMDALLDHHIMPDYIMGVSAGAAYGVSYASGQRGRNLEIFRRFVHDRHYAGIWNFFDRKNRSYFGLRFVYETIPRRLLPFDYAAFAAWKGEFYAGVTNVETGKPEYLKVNGCSKDRQRDIIEASCALPVLFPSITVDGKPYMDGGLSDSVPLGRTMKDGCDRIVVVLTRAAGYRKKTGRMTRFLARIYRKNRPALSNDLLMRAGRYNRRMEQIERMEREGRILVIRPETTYGVSRMERNRKKLYRLYEDGVQAGNLWSERIRRFFQEEAPTPGV